jgi:hypothetical protein
MLCSDTLYCMYIYILCSCQHYFHTIFIISHYFFLHFNYEMNVTVKKYIILKHFWTYKTYTDRNFQNKLTIYVRDLLNTKPGVQRLQNRKRTYTFICCGPGWPQSVMWYTHTHTHTHTNKHIFPHHTLIIHCLWLTPTSRSQYTSTWCSSYPVYTMFQHAAIHCFWYTVPYFGTRMMVVHWFCFVCIRFHSIFMWKSHKMSL